MNDRAMIEAVLFVAESPVTSSELAELLERRTAEVDEELETFQAELRDTGRGVVLRQVAGGWRLYAHPEARPYLERFAATERATRLSGAALEALAVVAYRQPVSRGQVSELRGVDSEHAMRTLERRGLITEVGKAPGPGSAVLYGTTEEFLEQLGVNAVGDLPPLADHVPPASIVDTLESDLRPEATSSGSTS
jgi:segregation and condensation protein B